MTAVEADEQMHGAAMFVPEPTAAATTQLSSFIRHVSARCDRPFDAYAEFESWAIEEYPAFWRIFLDWSGLLVDGSPDPACRGEEVEFATFFPELRLNYVQNLLRRDDAVRTLRAG